MILLSHLRRSVVSVVVFTAFFGFLYMLAGTGVAQLLFRHQADGSITANGSTLIGQNWSVLSTFDGTKGYWPSTRWFNGRPDASGPYEAVVCGTNAPSSCTSASGGDNPLETNKVLVEGKSTVTEVSGESAATNLGPRSKVLLENTQELVAWWRAHQIDPTPDLVTTSGSGLDPDISESDAMVQVPMIAKDTGISPSTLRALVASETQGAELGFLGSSYIDVLQLNEGLARLK